MRIIEPSYEILTEISEGGKYFILYLGYKEI